MSSKIGRRKLMAITAGIVTATAVGAVAFTLFNNGRKKEELITKETIQQVSSPAQASSIKVLARSDYHEEVHRKGLIPYFRSKTGAEVDYVPKGYNDLYSIAVLAMRNRSSEYDVLYLDEPWLLDFNEYAEEIDGVDLFGYPSRLVERVRAIGGLWAVPILGNFNFYFYRRDLLEKLGESPPKSMDDILRLTEEASEKLPSGVYAFTGNLTLGQGDGAAGDAYAVTLMAYGGAYFDPKDGVTPVLDSQEAVEALRALKIFKRYGHPQIATWTNLREIHESVYSGEAFSGLVWNGWIQYVDNPERSRVVGKVEIMPLPGKKGPVSNTGIWCYVVPKFSERKELAKQFVRLATSYEGQLKAHLETSMPPTRFTVYQSTEVRQRNRLAEAYVKVMEAGIPARTSPIWPSVSRPLNEVIARFLNDSLTAEDAVKQMHKILVDESKRRGLI
ncbi:ABC-type sugar transport system, periplasmic component [Pyrobaculum oguniense TE7]|uniref:ABC-type sugar transport system, periplasmic component n=1 Tax=Pyrobaculum oguniense (strain DSM 13380 / JCM 10595 / TE7) TaxID=698757 RepID=H6QCK8_PYROT|nr:ABC-type sugar transport system, periplasmic component [Pyrobaculum oguniense TE7]